MTDKELFLAVKRLDKFIMSSRDNLERATNDLADVINAVEELRSDRRDYRELLTDLGREK